jgi:hypothetical protein
MKKSKKKKTLELDLIFHLKPLREKISSVGKN